MAREDPEIRFRCPPDLKARIESAARAANRSMNAEIVHRLRDSLAEPQTVGLPPAPLPSNAEVMTLLDGAISRAIGDAMKDSKFMIEFTERVAETAAALQGTRKPAKKKP
jgi:hypothetical protein